MIERRRHPRAATEKLAKIVFNYNSVVDCTIREVSEAGARLELSSACAIPHTFDLITDDPDGAHICRVVWRAHDNVGVCFTG
jgi:hypothetical protein